MRRNGDWGNELSGRGLGMGLESGAENYVEHVPATNENPDISPVSRGTRIVQLQPMRAGAEPGQCLRNRTWTVFKVQDQQAASTESY
jgi:hypothetical protein